MNVLDERRMRKARAAMIEALAPIVNPGRPITAERCEGTIQALLCMAATFFLRRERVPPQAILSVATAAYRAMDEWVDAQDGN